MPILPNPLTLRRVEMRGRLVARCGDRGVLDQSSANGLVQRVPLRLAGPARISGQNLTHPRGLYNHR